jgi:S1-C subfamily serine protease
MIRKVLFWFVAAAMVASVVASVFAGGHECQVTAEECAKQLHAKYEKSAWLGIEKQKTPEGAVRVTAVTPGSPAAAAGFAVGDLLVAINGVALADNDSEAWKKVKTAMEPGRRVDYAVNRNGVPLTLSATLATPPEAVIDAWVKEHIAKEHTHGAVAAK